MAEVPSEADMERMAVAAERTCGPSALPLWVRWWRANVRPAEPTNLPAGESLLRDEQGLAVFRRPEKGEAWLDHWTGLALSYVGRSDPNYFGGRRFILAPRPTTAERIAADVRDGLDRPYLPPEYRNEVTRTVTNVLVERGYKHPEET